jgi:Uma2 family endonuclease
MATIVEEQAILEEEQLVSEKKTFPKPAPPTPKLTFEEASKLAAGNSFELIQGRMVFKIPDDKHSDSQILLGAELVNYFKANPIGRARTEYALRLWPEKQYEARTPDLSVILNESYKEERYGSRAPDLAIEIVSRDDRWTDLFEKAALYLENGSRVVWIVDPYQKGVMVVASSERRWITDTLTCPELLPGFSVNVKDLFAWPSVPQQEAKE